MNIRVLLLAYGLVMASGASVIAQDCTPVSDCNLNNQEDSCDIAEGLSGDCDQNGIPDECQMAESVMADCNMNGLLDACEPVSPSATTGTATLRALMEGEYLFLNDPADPDEDGAPAEDPAAPRSIEVYKRLGTSWNSDGSLTPADTDSEDGFGASIAMSGSLVVVGAPNKNGNTGAVYVFERQDLGWVQTQLLEPELSTADDQFGFSVDISGSTIAIGAPQSPIEEEGPVTGGGFTPGGYVEVWSHNGTIFERVSTITNTDPLNGGGEEVGSALQLTENNWLMIGSPSSGPPGGAGRVFGYRFNGTDWELATEILTTDSPQGAAFGTSLSWSGGTLAVTSQRTLGASIDDPMVGAVYTFELSEDESSWVQADRLISSAANSLEFGASMQLSGDMLVVGEPKVDSAQGLIHLYNRMADDTWSLVDTIRPAGTVNGDGVGTAVATNGEWIAYSADGLFTNIEHREIIPDCNANGADDRCEIRSGLIPDCNGNIIPDSCDIAAGTEQDCDQDGVPDDCFLANGGPDCNSNGVPDSCDIDSLQSVDCNLNGIPDECESDCDLNGIPDECDLALGAPDCNANGFLDSCDIDGGTSVDCDLNTIPDSCDLANGATDCDADLVPDHCQITANAAIDCDNNGAIDSCELLANASLDCNSNSRIDSCDIVDAVSADCDLNGTPDECQIASGFSIDCNSNAIPDECEDPFLESTPPSFLGSVANISLNTEPGLCGASASWTDPPVTDNCTEVPTLISSHVNGGQFSIGTTEVTLTASDEHGNSSISNFTVTVTDVEDPTITGMPETILINNDLDLCGAVVSWTEPTISDNCAVTSSGPDTPNGSIFSVGSHAVTYTATDSAGRTTNASFDIIVSDTQSPAFTSAPGNMILGSDQDACGAVASWTSAETSDNCGILSTNSSHSPGDFFPTGETTVTITTFDTAGLSTEHSFTVTVNDTQAPTLSQMPENMVVHAEAGLCEASVQWVAPLTFDNCPDEVLQGSHTPGQPFAVGTHTVTYNVVDSSGLTATDSFQIVVEDHQDPQFDVAPMTMNLLADSGACQTTAIWDLVESSDNCGVLSLTSTHQSGDEFLVGTTTVTMTLEDLHGNQAIHSFDVLVEDLQNPQISGMPETIEQDNDSGICGAQVSWIEPTSSDNCEIDTFTSSHLNGGTYDVGTTTVTYTAKDIYGNTTTSTFDIVITDNELPTISSLSGNLSASNDTGSCGAIMTWSDPRAADNCSIQSFTSSSQSGDFFDIGTTTVTYSATDIYGNQFEQSFDITISDSENPTLSDDLGDITATTDPDLCNAFVSWTEPTALDNCSGASHSSDISNGSTFDLGDTLVTYTAVDAAGNSSQVSFTVTVLDEQNPSFDSAPQSATLSSEPGQCYASHSWAAPETSDNCIGLTLNTSHPSGTEFGVGSTDVTMFLSDAAGNTVQHTFTVSVLDEEDPQITGIPTDMNLSNDAGLCGAFVDWALPVGSDNCSVSDLVSSHDPGDFFNTGTTTVSYSAADGSGNLVTLSFNITVTDDEAPIIATAGDLTITSPAGTCSAFVSIPEATGVDNCQLVALTNNLNGGSDASGTYDYGTTVVTWTATDSAGNTSTFDQSVSVTVDMTDCNGNSVPDVCEVVEGSVPDCNGNGIPDSCDLVSGAAEDCNGSGIPDSCEVATGAVSDCDGNGTPDECDTDCDGSGTPDACDLANGIADDCNGNDIPDSCDLASGFSVDTNGNSTPDACEPSFRRGDANEDGSVDIADAIFMLYTLMLNGPQSGCADATDSNDSGTHDIADAVFILTYQFAGGSAPPSPGADVCGVDATPDDGMSCDSYSGCP